MINLIIGGGGLKGICFLGALEYLHNNNLVNKINNFYGASIGSVIGILYYIGYSPMEIFIEILNLNLEECWDFNFDNIDKHYSLITGVKYNINLNIYATSLFKRKNICFNYNNYPDVEILTAMEASCSIPLIFPPVIINGEYFIDGCVKYIDGIVSDDVYMNKNDINIIIKTYCKPKELTSYMNYITEVLNCFMQNEEEINTKHTLSIELSDDYRNKYNFNDLDNSCKLELFYIGIKQSKEKFEKYIKEIIEEQNKKNDIEEKKIIEEQ
jgi:predicted patatin/cPLA2 family phospholipase